MAKSLLAVLFLPLFLWNLDLIVKVNCLSSNSVAEGSCLPPRAPTPTLNMTWFLNTPLPYFAAGSKYDMYQAISGYSRFNQLREFEFYYRACITRSEIPEDGSSADVFAFGGVEVGHSDFLPSPEPGVLNLYYTNAAGVRRLLLHNATLTDNESFVFFTNCWADTNQRGWAVLSNQGELDRNQQNLIEQHALSQGFDRSAFIFFRRESC